MRKEPKNKGEKSMKKKLFNVVFVIILTVIVFATRGSFIGVSAQEEPNNGDIFTYTYDGQVFESEFSEDDAWTKAMLYQVEHGILTMEEVEDEYSSFSSRDIIEEMPLFMPMASGTSLTGRAQWQPSASALLLPLQRVKVELYIHYANLLPM